MSFEAFLGELRADANERRVPLPPGTVDCDVRITSISGKASPKDLPEHPPEAYRETQDELGLSRVVLIQPDELGFDNSTLLSSLGALAGAPDGLVEDCARAFCMVRPGVDAAELEDLAAEGVTGMRVGMLRHRESCPWDEIDRHVRRVHDLTGWDVELAMDGSDLHEIAQTIRAWPCNIILPELGGFRFSRSLMQPGFRALRHLIDRGRVWVKLAAPYAIAKEGQLDDPEVIELADALVDWAPERMVWGSAWPHLNWPREADSLPENLGLMESFGAWVSDGEVRDRIFCENPEVLYGFKAWLVAK
ncbi:amidohydrolase family protein [Nisaea sp.]|uniref:amidohydrolase family protein n=1 Tax=Nisaea sp. TaxID=2024842 RepID=UPI0032659A82